MRSHRSSIAAALVALSLLLGGCGEIDPPSSPPSAPSGVAPVVPDPDPRPSGPNRFDGVENATEEENAAWRKNLSPGTLALTVLDAGTGEPVTSCDYTAFQFAFTREGVDRRLPVQIDGPRPPEQATGVHPFTMAEGWWRIQTWMDGYRPTWTARFRIEKGVTTDLTLRVLRLNRLKLTVLDPDGKPLAKGALLARHGEHRQAITIRDGVADPRLELDELTLHVVHYFDEMTGFRVQSWPVKLRYAETTEVEIQLERRSAPELEPPTPEGD